ncbi:MAG: hypothetical protein IT378_25450 [Sandaracinaceae bacterium]|nr:hypothetical protein [Sandaracinaceae bacterium]
MQQILPLLSLAFLLAAASGCRRMSIVIDRDGAVPELDAPAPSLDTDGDGLCDQTEHDAIGSDPLSADTDADGIPDRYEADLGYDTLRGDSPDRTLMITLAENGSITLPIVDIVNGAGQSFAAAATARPVFDPFEVTAQDFLGSTRALSASPEENVFEIDAEGARFVGVEGRTRLVFTQVLAGEAVPARACARLYPWRFEIKRDDGRIMASRRYLLAVLPPGERPETATWCPFDSCR